MRVLFIGNSHTFYNDMPKLFRDAAERDGVKLDVTMLAHPGWFLEQHTQWPELKFNILYGNYDYVVLQEHAHPFGPEEKMYNAVRIISELVKQAGAKLVIYATWAPKIQPDVQERMSRAHRFIAEEVGALLAPVDERWCLSREENPDIELYFTDGQHASLAGSTLVANTIWETVKKDIKK